jgi:hypothetical protein
MGLSALRLPSFKGGAWTGFLTVAWQSSDANASRERISFALVVTMQQADLRNF